MLYARSDVKSFSGVPGCPAGGHNKTADPDHDGHFAIDCAPCEVVLRSDPLWSSRLREVPLTDDQTHDLEDRRDEAQAGSAALGVALQDLLRERMALAPAPAAAAAPALPPDLV